MVACGGVKFSSAGNKDGIRLPGQLVGCSFEIWSYVSLLLIFSWQRTSWFRLCVSSKQQTLGDKYLFSDFARLIRWPPVKWWCWWCGQWLELDTPFNLRFGLPQHIFHWFSELQYWKPKALKMVMNHEGALLGLYEKTTCRHVSCSKIIDVYLALLQNTNNSCMGPVWQLF